MRTGGKINMNKNSKKYILLKLFFTTIYISTFTFGGGFVIITFMKKKFVDELDSYNGIQYLETYIAE